MGKETMTQLERSLGAIRFQEKTDRVPIVMNMCIECHAKLCGELPGTVYREGRALEYVKRVVDMLGPWDGDDGRLSAFAFSSTRFWTPITFRFPGVDLPDDSTVLCDEKEWVTVQDMENVLERGYYKGVRKELYERVMGVPEPPEPTMEEVLAAEKKFSEETKIPLLVSNHSLFQHPFFDLSLGRSFIPFAEDLYYRGDLIEKVISIMTDEIIPQMEEYLRTAEVPIIYFIEERASGMNFPMKIFERFWFPYFKKIVYAVRDMGGLLMCHFDQDWKKNLPYFKELPDNVMSFELDSLTDMKLVREMLGNKVCLKGDVPGTMLSLGSPDEVREYVKHTIDTVGRDGGLIISGGCEIPMDAKRENLEVMLDVARSSFY